MGVHDSGKYSQSNATFHVTFIAFGEDEVRWFFFIKYYFPFGSWFYRRVNIHLSQAHFAYRHYLFPSFLVLHTHRFLAAVVHFASGILRTFCLPSNLNLRATIWKRNTLYHMYIERSRQVTQPFRVIWNGIAYANVEYTVSTELDFYCCCKSEYGACALAYNALEKVKQFALLLSFRCHILSAYSFNLANMSIYIVHLKSLE